MGNKEIIDLICQRAVACLASAGVRLQAIYVFGSFGTEYFKLDSDIDLGFLCERPMNAGEVMGLIKALDLPGGHVVDIVDLRAVDLEMQDIIISERRMIFIAEDAREEVEDYEHYVWVMYLTLCEDRKEIIEQIQKTGIIYGPDYIEKGRIRKPVHKAH